MTFLIRCCTNQSLRNATTDMAPLVWGTFVSNIRNYKLKKALHLSFWPSYDKAMPAHTDSFSFTGNFQENISFLTSNRSNGSSIDFCTIVLPFVELCRMKQMFLKTSVCRLMAAIHTLQTASSDTQARSNLQTSRIVFRTTVLFKIHFWTSWTAKDFSNQKTKTNVAKQTC